MTSERRRSCAAEPVNAIFEVADISSMLPTFVSAPILSAFFRLSSSKYFRHSDHRGIFSVGNGYFCHFQLIF